MEQLKEQVVALLMKLKPEIGAGIDKNFIDDGILDSLDIMNLIMDLEEEFDIEIDPEDVITDNFETTDAIVALVNKCRA